MFHKNKMIHFSGRIHPIKGIIAAILGILIILGFGVISVLSALDGGNGSLMIGVVGLILLAVSIIGFVLSYQSMKEKDIFYVYPIIGIISNGVMLILLFVLYVIGIII